jgi:O-acetyl-ADP-ribose deacetylase (regulator of RNase III)
MKSHLQLEVREGDILRQPDVEAVVIPTSDYLMLSGELGGRVRAEAGEEVDREAQAKGPVNIGDVEISGAGRLPLRHLLHAAVIGLRQEDVARFKEVRSLSGSDVIAAATLNSLDVANLHRVLSLAMPPLAASETEVPLSLCAELMVRAITDWSKANPESVLQRVVIVCPDGVSYEVFDRKAIETKAA